MRLGRKMDEVVGDMDEPAAVFVPRKNQLLCDEVRINGSDVPDAGNGVCDGRQWTL